MKFEQYFKLSSSFLIFTGLYSILITGSYIGPTLLGIIITGIHALLWDRLPSILPIPKWVWNTLAVLLFSYLFYDSFFGALDLVGNGIHFVVYLQAVKLLSPKTNRDWIQIYALSFLHLLASTVISSDITFALPFLVYIVLATWTLTLFNIKIGLEESLAPQKRGSMIRNLLRSKELITSRFLAVTSLLSILVIVFTMIIFFSFPRLSMGQFLRRVEARQKISGFSEQVELGTIGTIKTSDTIAMRVELTPEAIAKIDIEHLYWRGTATDFFDGRKWSQSEPDRQRIRLDPEAAILDTNQSRFPGGQHFEYNVFLEALSTPILIGADRLMRVTWEKPFVERIFRGVLSLERNDVYQSFHFVNSQNFVHDLTYRAESMTGQPDLKQLRGETDDYPFHIRSYYLQLPPLEPDVKKLLREIKLPESSVYDRAMAIQQFLESNYSYTLDVKDIGVKDPLSFFLVEKKQGHCEYFSTALVIALRFFGIPARNVVGFRGGELNPYGRYIAVRQSDAHSWTEVFFPRSGWIRFDPSPLDHTVWAPQKRFKVFFQLIDYLRLRWNKYVIEYDLRAQASIIERMGKHLSKITKDKKFYQTDEKDSSPSSLQKFPQFIFWSIIVGVAILFLILRTFHHRQNRRSFDGFYYRVLKLLSKNGYKKDSHQTAREFTHSIEAKIGILPSLTSLTSMYYEERFGRKRHPLPTWQRHIFTLQKDLSKSKKTSPRN